MRGDGVLRAPEERVEGSVGHGLETEERLVVEEMEVRDDGRSGTLEEDREDVRDDRGSGTLEERDDAACGPSSEEAPTATKRRKLSAIVRMGDESLQDWLDSLPREDLQQMALLLYTRLPAIFGLKKTDTAAAVSEVLQKNKRTVRRWVDDFASNSGEFSESQQGHYARMTLMSNEEICKRARVYVRKNAAPKGRPNLTAVAFCYWVNNNLLPNSTLEPGFPRRLSGNGEKVAP